MDTHTGAPPTHNTADVSGQWTRGTPFHAPPPFVPRSSKPLLQLSARPAQPHPPTAAAATAATGAPAQSVAASAAAPAPVEWSTVSGRKRATIPHAVAGAGGSSPVVVHSHASAAGGPLLTLAASVHAARTQGPQRGLLALPIGTLPPAHRGPDATGATASPAAAAQPAKAKASKPHKSWALSELLDLSSLRQLDAIAAKRAANQSQSQQQQQQQQSHPSSAHPPLPSRPSLKPLPAWGATATAARAWGPAAAASASAATAATPIAAAPTTAATAANPTATPAPLPSALKTQRSASHKSLSSTARSVAFSGSGGIGEHRPAARPRSASVKPVKSARRIAAAAAEGAGEGAKAPPKRAKPTALKKQLVRERAERLHRFIREEILQPLVQRAMGVTPEPTVPSSAQEARQQLAALSRRIKKANYEAKKAVHEQRQAEARANKTARIEENRRKRSEQQDAARQAKSGGQTAPLVAVQSDAVAEPSASSNHDTADAAECVTASPQQLSDADAAAALAASSDPHSAPEPSGSEIGSIAPQNHGEIESVSPSPNQTGAAETGEEKGDAPTAAADDQADSDASTSSESGSDAEGEDTDSDSECEFVPALPLPSSSHPLGHLPSATPPQPPSTSDIAGASGDSAPSSAAASSSSSAPRLQMLHSQRIPSSMLLTAHDEALLRWHFQSKHHGVQPSLQGAVKRHCKQMFKSHINQQTVVILKELRRFAVRLRERDPKRAALRLTYVSGLKQTSKLLRVGSVRCVVVAANIEANEAAGGLDDMLDEVMDLCEEGRVPIVFALDRAKLAHAVGLRNQTSAVAILDYSAVGDAYKQLLVAVSSAQEEWRMLQEDTLLNPRPEGWAEAHAADLAHIAARKAARAAALAAHESAYARAEAERKASLAAQQSAKGGKKKKKKSGESGGGGGGGGKGRSKRDRELLPLPTLSEEDAKRGRRKGRRGAKRKDQEGGAGGTDAAATTSAGAGASSGSGAKVATTASQLKGAGRALSAIAEAMADEQKSASGSGGGAAAKSAKKVGKDAAAPAPAVADDSRSKKKGGGGGKSDKKGGKGKSHK